MRLGGARLVLLLGIIGGTIAAATPAWAHVTVHPSSLPAGSTDVELTFRVPNERSNANTVKLDVLFPSTLPLLTVDVLPVPGWTSAVRTTTLRKPVQTDDGEVSQVVSQVIWTAVGGGVRPGQYEDFDVAAGSVPDTPGRLVFKALQVYSSGEIVRWIEVPAVGQPEPSMPAPVLTLIARTVASAPGGTAKTTSGSPSSGSTGDTLAIVAVVLSALSLLGTSVLLVRARRRARSGP